MLISLTVSAQSADSLRKKTDTVHKALLEPAFDFDQRFYYTQKIWTNVWGYREGLILNGKYKVGIGEYYMNQNINETPIPKDINPNDHVTQDQKLYFGTAYFEPFLFRWEYLETSLVFEAGYGRTVNTYSDNTSGLIYNNYNKYFVPAGAGVSANLKFPALFGWHAFRWFGINVVAGYRQVLWQGDTVHDYNGVYWSISSAIFLDRMYEDIILKRHKTAKAKVAE
jgi:hypothetical protein